MLLPLLLSIPHNQLNNYSSYYELFAGFSSALAGIHTFRAFIIDKLGKVMDSMTSRVEQAKLICETNVSQLIAIFNGGVELDQTGKDHLQKLLSAGSWLDKIKYEVDSKAEVDNLNQISIGIFMYVFYSCILFLVLGGKQADNVLSDERTFFLIANYLLISFVSFWVIVIGICYKRFLYKRPVRFSACIFIPSVVIPCLITPQKWFLGSLSNTHLIEVTLVFCIVPLLILLFRGIIYLPYIKLFNIERKLKAIDKQNDLASEWVLAQVGLVQ